MDKITAASISRLMRHFEGEAVEVGIAILTADRGDRADDPQTNAALNRKARKRLEGLLKRHGLRGWVNVKGGYVEDKDTGVAVYEHSYFVPHVSRDIALKLAKAVGEDAKLNDDPLAVKQDPSNRRTREESFRQDAILWGNREHGAWLFFHNGGKDRIGSAFVPKQLDQYFTEWHGRRFAFASVETTIEYLPRDPSDYRQWRRHLVAV